MTTTRHQFPHWRDIRPLLHFQRPEFNRRQSRLRRALTIDDLRRLAMRTTPRPVFDYTDGAAEDEISLRRAIAAFASIEFHPHVLRDVGSVDTRTMILGREAALPLILAPTGFTRMMHHAGETAVVRAAEASGVPYALSTVGTTPVESVVAAAAGADVWFQLYVWRDRGRSKALLDRVRAAGSRVLVVTVDVPVAGARLRDTRNGLTIPPTLTLRSMVQMALRPRWWFNLLTTEPLRFASFTDESATLADIINNTFDPAVTLTDVAWLREQWQGPLVVKGLQRLDDAVDIVNAGADGLVLSTHGGRQLDRSVVPLRLLPKVVEAVGDRTEIFVDTGVRRGADIAAAVSMGARGVLVGRPYLYGLMAGGQAGVERAIQIFSEELTRTLQLLGCTRLDELRRDLVVLREESTSEPDRGW